MSIPFGYSLFSEHAGLFSFISRHSVLISYHSLDFSISLYVNVCIKFPEEVTLSTPQNPNLLVRHEMN